MTGQTESSSGAPPARASRWPTSKAPARPGVQDLLRFTAISLVMLLVLAAVGKLIGLGLFSPPLAATAMIIASVPATPPAAPRSVLGGHVLSAIVGFIVVAIAGQSVWGAAVAAGVALTVMVAARAPHAPAAATAALVVAQRPDFVTFMGALVLGSILLIALGVVAGLVSRAPKYPTYWW